MSEHTPGPWKISGKQHPANSEPYDPGLVYISGPDWFDFCSVYVETAIDDAGEGTETVPSPIGYANARLIAAAPLLLKALQGLCEADRDDLNDSTSAPWNAAAAAIAKATTP